MRTRQNPLLVLLVGMLLLGACARPQATITPTPTSPVGPTPTATPSPTPAPQARPIATAAPSPTPTSPVGPTPTATPFPTPTPQASPVATATPSPTPAIIPLPTAVSQELAEIENYTASRFYPDTFVALRGVPLRLYITRLHIEHVNRFTIERYATSTAFFTPGTMGFIEFTPDRTGEFRIRNEGHQFDASLVVVESENELRNRWVRKGVQEFSLIHDFTNSQVAPKRLVVYEGIPVRLYNTGLGGQDKISIPPFYLPTAPNVEQGKISVFEFTPTVIGEFPINYETHKLSGALVVRGRP